MGSPYGIHQHKLSIGVGGTTLVEGVLAWVLGHQGVWKKSLFVYKSEIYNLCFLCEEVQFELEEGSPWGTVQYPYGTTFFT